MTIQQSSENWIRYFQKNAAVQRIDWDLQACISETELNCILPALQAWQLAETGDGANLILATQRYVGRVGDPDYLIAVRLFIKEEQKHGSNLGMYLDRIGRTRLKKNWSDTLFRKARHLNSSMEIWTLTVIIVESAAQLFYQSMKDATGCALLRQICTDILIDEAFHISFQAERIAVLLSTKTALEKAILLPFYRCFFALTSRLIWFAHAELFKAGGHTYRGYLKRMNAKFRKNVLKAFTQNYWEEYFSPQMIHSNRF